jgi:phage baseplate assembly protein W
MPTFQTFKDLSITFKKHPVSNDLVTVKDNAAIAQSIAVLLQSSKGERLFQPELGSDLREMLFEPLDFGTAALIKSKINDCIGRYEPRVTIKDILCFPDEQNDGYSVELYYTITGNDRPVTATFFLARTR